MQKDLKRVETTSLEKSMATATAIWELHSDNKTKYAHDKMHFLFKILDVLPDHLNLHYLNLWT